MRGPFLMLWVLLLVGPLHAEKPADGTLDAASYEAWRDHVLPRDWELKYEEIGWRTSFWDAVVEAQEKDKPILLWAMNGHPLCNT